MTPVLSEEQMKEAVSKYQKVLTDKGAQIVQENNWGLRKLAYPIQKKSTGFYHLMEFSGNSDIIKDFEVALKRDERILRFLTIKLDKHGIAYTEKKRRARAEAKEDKK